jgi:hypothetical protein
VREFYTHLHARSMCGCALHRLSYSVMNDAKIEKRGRGGNERGGEERESLVLKCLDPVQH